MGVADDTQILIPGVFSADDAEDQVNSAHSEPKTEIYLSQSILFSVMSLDVF
jgi:hypothetical protein